MAKRGSSPEATRDTIRMAAVKLFQSEGVHAASLADIAGGAGVSKGTLYYHYPTKEELVLEIAEEHFAMLTARLYEWMDELAPGDGAYGVLAPLAETFLGDEDEKRLHFALLGECMRESGELRRRMCAKHREWAVMLELGALRLREKMGQIKNFGGIFIALISGSMLHTLIGEDVDASFLIRMLTDAAGEP